MRLLETLTNTMSTALENARLFGETKRLLKPDERATELAIINSVQEALASKLEMSAIYKLVGDKIRDIFDAQVVNIGIFDSTREMIHYPVHHRARRAIPEQPNGPSEPAHDADLLETREPLLINDVPRREPSEGASSPGEMANSPSPCIAPLSGGEPAASSRSRTSTGRTCSPNRRPAPHDARRQPQRGARECAPLRRDATPPPRRAAELAIVNDVQPALAAQLDPQAMYELVGARANDVFDTHVVDIAVFDQENGTMGSPYSIERGSLPGRRTADHGRPQARPRDEATAVDPQEAARVGPRGGQPDHIKGEPALSAIFVPMLVGDGSRASSPCRTSTVSMPSTIATSRCS